MNWLMWLAVIALVIAAIVVKIRRAGFVVLRTGMTMPPEKPAPGAERMLRCEHCSLYIPESEAVHRSGAVFCCQEHGLSHFPR